MRKWSIMHQKDDLNGKFYDWYPETIYETTSEKIYETINGFN